MQPQRPARRPCAATGNERHGHGEYTHACAMNGALCHACQTPLGPAVPDVHMQTSRSPTAHASASRTTAGCLGVPVGPETHGVAGRDPESVVTGANPATVYPVTADPVLYVTTDHDAPAFELTCTLYPTIGEPPLSAGAVQVRSTEVARATPPGSTPRPAPSPARPTLGCPGCPCWARDPRRCGPRPGIGSYPEPTQPPCTRSPPTQCYT